MRLELTKRADYAIRTILSLARAADGEQRSVRQVAAEQRIPARFLPQIMGDLKRAGLVEGTVGRRGGYRLVKLATEISLLDVVEAVEGDSRRRVCILRGGPCATSGVCAVHAVFSQAQDEVLGHLRAETVEKVIRDDPGDPPGESTSRSPHRLDRGP